MIVIFIMLILVSIAIPNFNGSVQRARESVLRQNLFQPDYHSDGLGGRATGRHHHLT
ncbi:MAG: hypothetical protein DMG93_22500 [Acidobacteria bacterium]|nr:MAG: hypothetical protein DMG93_22500 [Acidobacteriota bacterium]